MTMYCFVLLIWSYSLTVTSLLRMKHSLLNYTDCTHHKTCQRDLCFLPRRTCSQLWSKGRLVRPTRTVCSCLTSSCQTSTRLCRHCFATCRSAAAASIPTCTTMARSVSVCWAPGLAKWVLFYLITWLLDLSLEKQQQPSVLQYGVFTSNSDSCRNWFKPTLLNQPPSPANAHVSAPIPKNFDSFV